MTIGDTFTLVCIQNCGLAKIEEKTAVPTEGEKKEEGDKKK
jgi:hypothetical protein